MGGHRSCWGAPSQRRRPEPAPPTPMPWTDGAARSNSSCAEGRAATAAAVCSQCGPSVRPPPPASATYHQHHHHHQQRQQQHHHHRTYDQRSADLNSCYGCDCAQCRSSSTNMDMCCQQCCACAAPVTSRAQQPANGTSSSSSRQFKVRSMTLRGENDETLEVCIAPNDEGACCLPVGYRLLVYWSTSLVVCQLVICC